MFNKEKVAIKQHQNIQSNHHQNAHVSGTQTKLETMRLERYIAMSGLTSRRNAVELIKRDGVYVNGTKTKVPSKQVADGTEVTYRGKKLTIQKPVYVVLHKPTGYLCTAARGDAAQDHRPSVLDLVAIANTTRLYPVGRLDCTTKGVIVLTNDGEVTQKLLHPSRGIHKTYKIRLHAPLSEEIQRKILSGVMLEDGFMKADRIMVLSANRTTISVSVHSGKHRIVRRMFECFGYHVVDLERIMFAGITAKGLAVGQWRYMTSGEIERLMRT